MNSRFRPAPQRQTGLPIRGSAPDSIRLFKVFSRKECKTRRLFSITCTLSFMPCKMVKAYLHSFQWLPHALRKRGVYPSVRGHKTHIGARIGSRIQNRYLHFVTSLDCPFAPRNLICSLIIIWRRDSELCVPPGSGKTSCTCKP